MPLLICSAILVLAVAGALIAHRWMPAGEAAAFGFCCLWMNNDLSVAFSDRFYHGNVGVILPSVLMQLPIIAYVAFFGRWTTRRAVARYGRRHASNDASDTDDGCGARHDSHAADR